MATRDKAQTETIARGLRFDAAEEITPKQGDPYWRAVARSSDQRTGAETRIVGEGPTEAKAYDDLIGSLPARPDSSTPICPMCYQPLPAGFALGSQRYDAPE